MNSKAGKKTGTKTRSRTLRKLRICKALSFDEYVRDHQGVMVSISWADISTTARYTVSGNVVRIMTTLNEVVVVRLSAVSSVFILEGDSLALATHELAENLLDKSFGMLGCGFDGDDAGEDYL